MAAWWVEPHPRDPRHAEGRLGAAQVCLVLRSVMPVADSAPAAATPLTPLSSPRSATDDDLGRRWETALDLLPPWLEFPQHHAPDARHAPVAGATGAHIDRLHEGVMREPSNMLLETGWEVRCRTIRVDASRGAA